VPPCLAPPLVAEGRQRVGRSVGEGVAGTPGRAHRAAVAVRQAAWAAPNPATWAGEGQDRAAGAAASEVAHPGLAAQPGPGRAGPWTAAEPEAPRFRARVDLPATLCRSASPHP